MMCGLFPLVLTLVKEKAFLDAAEKKFLLCLATGAGPGIGAALKALVDT
jgi:hypothetical protein